MMPLLAYSSLPIRPSSEFCIFLPSPRHRPPSRARVTRVTAGCGSVVTRGGVSCRGPHFLPSSKIIMYLYKSYSSTRRVKNMRRCYPSSPTALCANAERSNENHVEQYLLPGYYNSITMLNANIKGGCTLYRALHKILCRIILLDTIKLYIVNPVVQP